MAEQPMLPRHPLDKTGDVPRIPRSQIKLCDYNPRSIGADEKRRLKRSLEANGLSQPFVWNKSTSNLVGGHQRISILDKSAPADEWAVPVVIRELSDTEERQLNIALNAESAMGRFDDFKLAEILKIPTLDITACGFDLQQIKTILPQVAPTIPVVAATLAANSEKWKQYEKDKRTNEDLAVGRILDGQEIGDKHEARVKEQDDQFWVCFIWESFAGKMKCLQSMGIDPGEQFVKGEVLEIAVKKE